MPARDTIAALASTGRGSLPHSSTRVTTTTGLGITESIHRVHDFQYEGAEIVASTCSGITGPVEEFQTNHSALGFDEAKVGGTFIKIGVGVLRKDSAEYDYFKQYEIVDPGKWRVETHGDSVEFTQELTDPATGYGYIYRKTVRLVAGKPEMVLEHSLKNTGRRAIHTQCLQPQFSGA